VSVVFMRDGVAFFLLSSCAPRLAWRFNCAQETRFDPFLQLDMTFFTVTNAQAGASYGCVFQSSSHSVRGMPGTITPFGRFLALSVSST